MNASTAEGNASSTNLDLISTAPVNGYSIWPFEDLEICGIVSWE